MVDEQHQIALDMLKNSVCPYLTPRQKIYRKYSYRLGSLRLKPQKVTTRKEKLAENTTELSMDPEIKEKIGIAESARFVHSTKNIRKQLYKELQESDMRLKRIKNGCPLAMVYKTPVRILEPQLVKDKGTIEECEITEPKRDYFGLKKKFYYPNSNFSESISERAKNVVLGVQYRLNKLEIERNNRYVSDFNRRSARREKAIKMQYNDFVECGLVEARRRAARAYRFAELSEQRKEEWWTEFVNSFNPANVSNDDISLLELMINVELEKENHLLRFIKKAQKKGYSNSLLEDLLIRSNELGKYISPARLKVILKMMNTTGLDNVIA